MIKLERRVKNCPFCGGKARIFQIPENTPEEKALHPGTYVVGCDTEGCFGEIGHKTMVFSSPENAAKIWNRRAENG